MRLGVLLFSLLLSILFLLLLVFGTTCALLVFLFVALLLFLKEFLEALRCLFVTLGVLFTVQESAFYILMEWLLLVKSIEQGLVPQERFSESRHLGQRGCLFSQLLVEGHSDWLFVWL